VSDMNDRLRLAVIPLDPVAAYERAGYADRFWMGLNPKGIFSEVFVVTSEGDRARESAGFHLIPVSTHNVEKTLRSIAPDVIRGLGGFGPPKLACLARQSSAPVVISVHDSKPANIQGFIRYADSVWCVSQAVKDAVMSRGVHRSRVRVLPNWVELAAFHRLTDPEVIRTHASRFPRGRFILHVGRRAKQKNLDTVIRALALLPVDYHLVLVGAGDRLPYERLSYELGVSNRCFWFDSVPNTDLPLWYSWCDCFCVPSRWEGFGIVFIEAAACQTPIVTSNIAPMNEFLKHRKSALLLDDYESPAATATAIREICEAVSLRDTVAAGAREVALQFSRESVQELEAQLYYEVLSSGRRSIPRRLNIGLWRAQEALDWRMRRILRLFTTNRG